MKISKCIFTCFLIVCYLPIFAQDPIAIAKRYQDLNGIIYTIISKEAPLEYKFGEWIQGETKIVDTIYFNSDGLVSKRVDGLSNSERRDIYNGDRVRCRQLVYFYNANKQIDEIHNCGEYYKLFYEKEKVIKLDLYNEGDEKLIGRETWVYHPNGYTHTFYNSSGNIADIHTYHGMTLTKKSVPGKFTLNTSHQPIKYEYENANYKYIDTWEYNQHGDLISHVERRWAKWNNKWVEYNTSPYQEHYSYDYDEHDNWIIRKTIIKKRGPEETTGLLEMRDFVYFDSKEALAEHIINIENAKRQALLEAQLEAEKNKQLEQEKILAKKKEEEALKLKKAEEQHHRYITSQIKRFIENKLYTSKKEPFTLALRNEDNRLQFQINKNNEYFQLGESRPYKFDGKDYNVEADISERMEIAKKHPLTFSVKMASDEKSALISYGRYKFILITNDYYSNEFVPAVLYEVK